MPIPAPLLLGGLSLTAALSPLLTFAWFWQVKEWRWDRLREHVMRERSFWLLTGGRLRPMLIVLSYLLWPVWHGERLVIATMAILAGLSLAQAALRRQRMPVWTNKAKILVGGAALLDTLIIGLLAVLPSGIYALPLVAILQAIVFAAAWLAFLPVDRRMKAKIIAAASAVRAAHPDLLVIGITGSVGKTTTKELLAHILRERSPLFTPAHVNSEIGVAQWFTRAIKEKPDSANTPVIVEMGAYRTGEIATLCSFMRPRIGIVTFIGNQHLALFGSREALMRAKGELLQALPSDGHAFLNGDCDRCLEMSQFAAAPLTVVGTGGSADLEATDIEETPAGIRFRVGDTAFSVPLHGTHNTSNVLLAIATAEFLGMRRQAVAERIASFRPPHKTFEVREEAGVTILDDTHNASAASMKAAIAWANAQPFNEKVLLTSGLIELGEEHARTHRELGALAAPVFSRVYVLDPRSAPLFAEGYGKPVATRPKTLQKLSTGSLLVCSGNMPRSVIRKLLP